MAKRKKIKVVVRKLAREKALGQAWQGMNLIEIDERQTPKMFGRVLVHEILHILDKNLSEAKVEKWSTVIFNILWDMGYRKIHSENKKMKD